MSTDRDIEKNVVKADPGCSVTMRGLFGREQYDVLVIRLIRTNESSFKICKYRRTGLRLPQREVFNVQIGVQLFIF